ncbi:MAG: molybdopterin-guanine dinucleotide biosynthesis protein B [Deltaproteobacteria bacterium]|jgi:molybdopterin-guanine dinucleotide biosynthesis protein MobB|nr:molybdopterin-guanine dinucleotide biosynthesis protein B [Deltaproteobacteria bacterium]
MIPIVSIVGRSDSGKTTLMEKLIPELVKRGYRVATIKHDVHGFDIDHEGKDSWRHKKAGASISIISSPWKVGLVEDVDRDHELSEIRKRYVRNVDLVLSEGYKGNNHPKIEVFRSATNHELLCSQTDDLLAIASDRSFNLGVPCVDINDAAALAEIIIQRFPKPSP